MRRFAGIKLAAIAAVVGLLVASPADAQRTGSRFGKNATEQDLPKAMRLMAECTVERRAGMVRSWFDTLPGTVEEDRILTNEVSDLALCFDDRMLVVDGRTIVVKAKMVRFPLALAMARRQLRSTSAAPTIDKDLPWFAPKLASLNKDAVLDRTALGLQDFGHCVAASDWANARALILSEEGSPEQASAITALTPVLGPCLQSDVRIKLTAANLRNALAEPMVHALGSGGAARSR